MNPIANLPAEERHLRLKAQKEVMMEGELVEGLLKSKAWEIVKRTIEAQLKSYKVDTQDAAKNRLKDIRAYIGRQEGLEWLIQCVEEDFIKMKNAAFQEMLQDEAFYKEGELQNGDIHREITGPTHPGNPGTI